MLLLHFNPHVRPFFFPGGLLCSLQHAPCTHLKKRSDVDVVTKVRESAGNDLPAPVVTVLPHFRDLWASKHVQMTKHRSSK